MINEIDFGLGYNLAKGDFSGRIGLERWNFTEYGSISSVIPVELRYYVRIAL